MRNLLLVFALFVLSTGSASGLHLETTHFVFDGDEKDITQEIVDYCEEQYFGIRKRFTHELEKKIIVNIYSDLTTYHKAINREDATDYNICSFDRENNAIHVVSIYNAGPYHYPLSIKASISGNIERSFLYSTSDLQPWLVEAIGFYQRTKILEENQRYTQKMQDALIRVSKDENNFKIANISNQNIFQLFEMESQSIPKEEAILKAFERRALSNSFINYIVNNWGYDYLLQLEQGKCFCKVFNMSNEELEKHWFEYTNNSF